MFLRFASVCLIVIQLAGCVATRRINFDSDPTGATVQLQGSTCTTPCVMQITSKEAQLAEISLAGSQKKVVRIEAKPTRSAVVGYQVSNVSATTLKWMAIPLVAVGLVGLGLLGGNETDTFENRDYEIGRDGF